MLTTTMVGESSKVNLKCHDSLFIKNVGGQTWSELYSKNKE